MHVPLGWAVLACGAAKSLAGAEPAAMLSQACEKRGRKAGDGLKVDAVEEKNHFRGIGAYLIKSSSSFNPGAGKRYLIQSTTLEFLKLANGSLRRGIGVVWTSRANDIDVPWPARKVLEKLNMTDMQQILA